MNTQLTAGSLFLEGLLSFFSPCVLPLIPLYCAYLTKGAQTVDEDGTVRYDRMKTFLLTLGFVLGISTVFAIAGLSTAALRSLFQSYRVLFELIGGMILLIMGLSVLGIIQIPLLNRITAGRKQEGPMSFLGAWVFGFTVSFAWTPCVGPMLAQAVLRASQAETSAQGWMYLGCYTLGFICIFLIAGLFTSEVLGFLKKYRGIVKYSGILSGIVVAGMGVWLMVQGVRDYSAIPSNTAADTDSGAEKADDSSAETDSGENATTDEFDFELADAEGNTVRLSSFKGQTVVLDFYETWCGYCNQSLGTLAKADAMDDVQVLMVVTPGIGNEGDIEYIQKYLKDQGCSFRLLIDSSLEVTRNYGVSGYPTTFFIQPDGQYYGYMPGYMPEEDFLEVIDSCRNSN